MLIIIASQLWSSFWLYVQQSNKPFFLDPENDSKSDQMH